MKKFLLAIFLLFLMKPVILDEASEDSSVASEVKADESNASKFNRRCCGS